ncbi:MAG: rhomboid family intramembrane serine protease [Acidobacteria bacterium]|nr:rhomboid family intramembrane serine protease [Acidobacteriota bacterium]
MLGRQRTGSVLCAYCGKLVGVNDETCWNCGRSNPGLWGVAPLLRRIGYGMGFVPILVWGCVILYLGTLIADPRGIGTSGLSILSPSSRSLFLFGASGAVPVFRYDRWWTLLSAGWLHGNLLHIGINLLWVRQLAPAAAELFGGPRMIIIYCISSVTGFLLTSVLGTLFGPMPVLGGAQFTVGASAPVFGLLGAMVLYGRRGGSRYIGSQAMYYAVVMFIFGIIMPGIDNYAHLGGFLGGYAVAEWLDPLQQERLGHLLAAVLLLFLSAGSVLMSLWTGRMYL